LFKEISVVPGEDFLLDLLVVKLSSGKSLFSEECDEARARLLEYIKKRLIFDSFINFIIEFIE